jgi:hypothetical protein
VSYYDLVKDPMGEVARIYDWMGLPLAEQTRRAVKKTLEVQTQHRYGKHRYRLEDFGLNRQIVTECFSDYIRRYDIPEENEHRGGP